VQRRGKPVLWFAALMLLFSWGAPAPAKAQKIDTIREVALALLGCWKPPPAWRANPMDITVVVSFNRDGSILGKPRISHESEHSSDQDRLLYRIAVMETLQRCTPLPFSERLGGAVAGRPFAVPFRTRKSPPKPAERRAWLSPKIP